MLGVFLVVVVVVFCCCCFIFFSFLVCLFVYLFLKDSLSDLIHLQSFLGRLAVSFLLHTLHHLHCMLMLFLSALLSARTVNMVSF